MTKQLQLVRYNFNHAAAGYAQNSDVQASPAQKLIAAIPDSYSNGLILDLGSGPGTFIHCPQGLPYPLILYDLSLKMLRNRRRGLAVNGDAQHLPFSDECFNLVISNLMLQWPENKRQVLQEIHRVLSPRGSLIFTTLIPPSLWQLKQAWQKLDHLNHTLNFAEAANYLELCQKVGFGVTMMQSWGKVFYFDEINQLLRHFKLTGTSLPKANGSGLGGRQWIQRLGDAYQSKRCTEGLPLSYHYLMLTVTKE